MDKYYHDHEQDERDYYEQMSFKRLDGCLFSFKAFLIAGIIFLLTMLFVGCSSAKLPATESIGTVISVDGDKVLVAFEVVSEQRGSQASNWFYVPRHSYSKGDRFPDPCKDPQLQKFCQ